jgi:hypothetical protein
MLQRVIGIGAVGLVLFATGACGDDDGDGGGTAAAGGGAGSSGSAGVGGDSGSGGGAGTTGGIPIEEVPPLYAAALCTALESCFGALYDELGGGEDCNQLLEKTIANGDFQSLQQAVESGKVTYDGTKMQACLDKLASSSCKVASDREHAECIAAADGTVEQGGDCNFDFECKSPAFCQVDLACPGKCAPLLAAKSACDRDDQCASGLVCTDPGTCEQPAGAGQSCQEGSATPCALGLLCIGGDPAGGTPGTCKAPSELFTAALGADCTLAGGPLCTLGLSCAVESVTASGVTTKCVAESSTACSISVPDMCPTGQYCNIPAQQWQGTCAPLPTDGQPCTAGDDCAPFTRCEAGTCRSMKDNGGTCQNDDTCYSGKCAGGACAVDTPCN